MTKGTIVRTVVLVYALINQVLIMSGVDTLPFESENVDQVASGVITVVASVIAWYKNNYVTKKGKEQRKVLEQKGLK